MDDRYHDRRAEFDARFSEGDARVGTEAAYSSPTGKFELSTVAHTSPPTEWGFSRGLVRRIKDGALVADIRRNLSSFWHTWVLHPNGCEYLLCGEDYQGYTVINLDTGTVLSHFPDEGYRGSAFCWGKAYPSPSQRLIAVDGCVWAAPYEIVVFDFSQPETVPFPVVARSGYIHDWCGWIDESAIEIVREVEFRLSDGCPYDDLTEDDQRKLDESPSMIGYRYERQQVVFERESTLDGVRIQGHNGPP